VRLVARTQLGTSCLGCGFGHASPAWAQGETTSAIIGQVTDTTGAVVPDATVTVTNQETGLKRTVKTDSGGRLNFPQLKPGTYTVRVEAEGFEPQQANNVFSGLGQKQTVNVTLSVAQSKETVEVGGGSADHRPEQRKHLYHLERAGPGGPAESRRGHDLPFAVRLRRTHQYSGQRQRFCGWHQRIPAMWNSTDSPRSPTATSSMGWRRTIRSLISIVAWPPISCWD
jgi:hypothetical protein